MCPYFTAGPIDHRILGNRSKVFLDSGSFDSALEDAETCCSLKPCWSKVCNNYDIHCNIESHTHTHTHIF